MLVDRSQYLWLMDQDRERMFQQRALERAARSGGEQRPGLARGGITGFFRDLRQTASGALRFRFGSGPHPIG